MRRRTIWILGSVALVALAIVGAFLLRKRAAPEPARLLPEADAYLYFNLKPLRKFGVIGRSRLPVDDQDYARFVQETGFEFERDLDEAAFAVHSAPRLQDVEPVPGSPEPFRRFSEIFVGRFDTQRVDRYMRTLARSVDQYRNVSVYSIPLEGRTVRVALLGVGIAAVSNTDGPQAIQYMIDRYKEVALPFGGPKLVREYYRHVPLASLLWGIADVKAQQGSSVSPKGQIWGTSSLKLPGGFDLLFPADAVVVASARYTTAIDIKAEAFTGSPELAKQIVDQAGAFLAIFRGLESAMSPSGADPDVKAFFDSLAIEQYKNRAILKASMPPAFLKKAFSEAPAELTGGQQPEEQPEPKKQSPRKKTKR